jgi:hypothetical protein
MVRPKKCNLNRAQNFKCNKNKQEIDDVNSNKINPEQFLRSIHQNGYFKFKVSGNYFFDKNYKNLFKYFEFFSIDAYTQNIDTITKVKQKMQSDFENNKGNVTGVFNFYLFTKDGYKQVSANDRLQQRKTINLNKQNWTQRESLYKPALTKAIDILRTTLDKLGLDQDKVYNFKSIEVSELLSLPDSLIQDFHLDYTGKISFNISLKF